MNIPARNTHTGTIMYWIAAVNARRILADGPTQLERHIAARRNSAAEIEDVKRDMDEIKRLSALAARVPGVRAGLKYMADNDNDIIGSLTVPHALREQEEIYDRIRRIKERHVDSGDAAYYSTPEEHIDYCQARTNVPLTGDAYSVTLLAGWPAGLAIPDGDGYMIEDGSIYASAVLAETADAKAIAEQLLSKTPMRYITSDANTITVTVAGEQRVITRRQCSEAAAQWNGGDAEQRALAEFYGALQILAGE